MEKVKSKKPRLTGVLSIDEEEVVSWVLKMQEMGHA